MLGKLTFMPGQTLFEEGVLGDHAYLITEGEVRVTANRFDEPFQLACLGPGDLIGEMALIDEQVRTATATALTDVEVIQFDRGHLESRLAQTDPLVAELLGMVLARLRAGYAQLLGYDQVGRGDGVTALAPSQASGELKLLEELKAAIQSDELNVVYQPIVVTCSGELAGFESLVRWPHPVRGSVPPYQFIGPAERSDLIFDLGEWVVRRVCRDLPEFLRASRSREAENFFVSINVAASQLLDDGHCTRLLDIVSESGVPAHHLKLEVTERMYISNLVKVRTAIERFKEQGISIAVDDFGTGYASLNYL